MVPQKSSKPNAYHTFSYKASLGGSSHWMDTLRSSGLNQNSVFPEITFCKGFLASNGILKAGSPEAASLPPVNLPHEPFSYVKPPHLPNKYRNLKVAI